MSSFLCLAGMVRRLFLFTQELGMLLGEAGDDVAERVGAIAAAHRDLAAGPQPACGSDELLEGLAIGGRHDVCSMILSSVAPSGVRGRPRPSRMSARRMVSSGTPCCRAIEATTAESHAAA